MFAQFFWVVGAPGWSAKDSPTGRSLRKSCTIHANVVQGSANLGAELGAAAASNQSMSDNKTLDELKKLRDEVRVKVHLGEMEVKEWWANVEPQLLSLEESLSKEAGKAAESAEVLVDELGKAYQRMRDRLGGSK